eukprot:3192000-Rhodomonas_salina.1
MPRMAVEQIPGYPMARLSRYCRPRSTSSNQRSADASARDTGPGINAASAECFESGSGTSDQPMPVRGIPGPASTQPVQSASSLDRA